MGEKEFTGYYDKNKKEIREGDIIKFLDLETLREEYPEEDWKEQDTYGVVHKHEYQGKAEWILVDIDDLYCMYDTLDNVAFDSEIVGSIHAVEK